MKSNSNAVGTSGWFRLSIDKPSGISHADCELVSQQVGSILDDVVPGGPLDVSSPSIERELLTPADYQRFQWKKARIKFEW